MTRRVANLDLALALSIGAMVAGPPPVNLAPVAGINQTLTVSGGAGSAPQFAGMVPVVGAVDQQISTAPVLAFTTPVLFGTSGQIVAWNDTDNVVVATYDVTTAIGTGAGQVSLTSAGQIMPRAPAGGWPIGKRVAFTITAGALTNPSGIPIAAITDRSAIYFNTVGVFTQPAAVDTAAGVWGLTNLSAGVANWLFVADIEVLDTANKYLAARGAIDTRLTIEGGRVFIRLYDNAGVALGSLGSSAVTLAFPAANARRRAMAMAWDDGTRANFRVWANEVLILSGSFASTGNGIRPPTRFNATDGAGANSGAYRIRGQYFAQAATLPGTLPVPTDFFDAAGLWRPVFGTTVAGFTPTFSEAGNAAAWNARNGTDTTGTFVNYSPAPGVFAANQWTVLENGVSEEVVFTLGPTLPVNGTSFGILRDGGTTPVATAPMVPGDFILTGETNGPHFYQVVAINTGGTSAASDIKLAQPYARANLASVDAAGWTAVAAVPADFEGAYNPNTGPKQIKLSRPGYTTTGAPTTYTEFVTVSKRSRQPYPSQASLTTSGVNLTDYVYSGDTSTGLTINSTEVSPKPICNWVIPDKLVVGNSVRLEIVAFHRNARFGEQVACVEFTISDGTTTVTQKVSASAVSGRTGDRNAVIVYGANMDISTLANPAVLTCNAKVYPWVGDASSVANSATQSERRQFSPRFFTRNTTRFASPPIAVVASGGNDATGVVSTDGAVARATPFLTTLGAIKGLKAATGVTGGRIDGCEVWNGGGTFGLPVLASGDVTGGIQDNAHVTFRRDPTVTRSAAIFTFGLAAARTRFTLMRITDCTINRTGTLAMQGEAAANMEIILDDLTFDNAGFNNTIYNQSHGFLFGVELLNAGSSPIAAGTYENRMVRGLLCASGVFIESWLTVGCRLTGGTHGTGNVSNGSRAADGCIAAYNYCSGYRWNINGLTAGETASLALVQNVIEFFSATSNTGLGISADSATMNTAHTVIHHNTIAGFFNNGRTNFFYDENASVARTQKLMSSKGNIHVSWNNKGDVFMTNGARTGNWPAANGVGFGYELVQYDSASGTFRLEFPGLGSVVGTSTTTPVDPLFTSPAATTSGPTAGAGGGTYTLQSGSPAKNMSKEAVLAFDLAGTARPLTGTSTGAYQ